MLGEYSLKIFSAIFVTIYLARYLGPEQFGVLSYVLAVTTVFMAVSRLGMESILVRDLARHPELNQPQMSTAFILMLIAGIAAVLILAGLAYWLESNTQTRIYIWIISTGILFQSLLVTDYNFQSQVKAKYSSLAKSIALGISVSLKLIFIHYEAPLIYFAALYALDHLVIGITLLAIHINKKQPFFFLHFDPRLVKPLMASAWPIILSAIAANLYIRIDQIMIKKLLNTEQLGLYAAAIKIFEGWLFVPYIISISLLPAIVKIKSGSPRNYEKNLAMLFSLLLWSSAAVALTTTLFSETIISYTYGEEYQGSSKVLSIVMWASVFAALGSVTARYLTVEGMEKKIAVRTFAGLIINIALNSILIPSYGIEGAAYATLATLLFSNYLINYFDKNLSQLVRLCNSSITFKWLNYEK